MITKDKKKSTDASYHCDLSFYSTSSSDIIRKGKCDCPVLTFTESEQNEKCMNTGGVAFTNEEPDIVLFFLN